jgi:hypothetical protein
MAGVPAKPSVGTAGTPIAAQRLTVTSSSITFTTTFNASSNLIVAQVQSSSVIATFDTSTPTATNGFTLNVGNYYWNRLTAQYAKFIQSSSASTSFVYAQEFQIVTDSDTMPLGLIIGPQ